MIELSLNIEAIDALIKILNAQPAPLPWHLVDALHTMQEELDNEYESRADDYFNNGENYA
jgi:hypothetical protein